MEEFFNTLKCSRRSVTLKGGWKRSPKPPRWDKRRPLWRDLRSKSDALSLAEASWPACPALVADEAVARARPIPEDVRAVPEDHIAHDGVVVGRRTSESAYHDHPAVEGGGPGGDVIEDLVRLYLHAPRAEKGDADPRDGRTFFASRAQARVLAHRIAPHLEVACGTWRVG